MPYGIGAVTETVTPVTCELLDLAVASTQPHLQKHHSLGPASDAGTDAWGSPNSVSSIATGSTATLAVIFLLLC